jgi:hypothetical protein
MAGADGALSLGHVAGLTNMFIDIRAAGGADAGRRGDRRIIRMGTRGSPSGRQHRDETPHFDAME